MSATKRPPAVPRHRNCPEKPELSANEERDLRAALLLVTGTLDARPEPRDLWDALGRTDADVRHPKWLSKLPEVLRQALEAARSEGPGTQAATVHRVEIFFAKLCAMTLAGYETRAPMDLGGALVGLAEEQADVSVAAARALHDESDGHLEGLCVELVEAIESDEQVLDLASRALAERRKARDSRQLAYR